MSSPAVLTVDRHKLNLSNLDKALYPDGFTKAQVIDYYLRIAPVMLPYLKDRAVTLKRYPDGTDKFSFYEKNCPVHRPPWMKTAKIASTRAQSGDSVNHCIINDRASLVWAANLAALELHVPMAKAHKPNQPTAIVFDLDPGAPANILDCCRVAIQMRDALDHLGLKSFVKTSGSKGLHLYIPLNTKCTSDETKQFAKALADHFAQQNPKKITATMTRSLRTGKVFIDWSQNDEHKTTVCAYSLRAGATPLISTPLEWEEINSGIKNKKVKLLQMGPAEVLDRVERNGDLFSQVLKMKQRMPRAFGALG